MHCFSAYLLIFSPRDASYIFKYVKYTNSDSKLQEIIKIPNFSTFLQSKQNNYPSSYETSIFTLSCTGKHSEIRKFQYEVISKNIFDFYLKDCAASWIIHTNEYIYAFFQIESTSLQ